MMDRTWLPIVEIKGIPQSTLRYWCEKGKVKARKRFGDVWEVYLPALAKLAARAPNEPPPDTLSEIDEVFAEAGTRPNKPLSSAIDDFGTRKK